MDLLFDLDGTLTDSAPGITRCLEYALVALGRPAPPLDHLRRHIGLPLWRVLGDLLATDEQPVIEAAVAHYRDRFSTVGLYENAPYTDVPEGLAALRRAGHRLWVVTSKPEVYARRIVEHFELASLFEGVHGSELSGENTDKGTLVGRVLAAEHLDPANARMIGDRAEDIRGGCTNGTGTIAVLWGYGSEQELAQAAPDVMVRSMAELVVSLTGRPDA